MFQFHRPSLALLAEDLLIIALNSSLYPRFGSGIVDHAVLYTISNIKSRKAVEKYIPLDMNG